MNKLIRVFWIIAILGFSLSLVVHITALLQINIEEGIPGELGLFMGVFIVWLPTILWLNKKNKKSKLENSTNSKLLTLYQTLFGDAPKYVGFIALFVYVYGMVIIFTDPKPEGSPKIIDGRYVLEGINDFIQEISEKEYNKLKVRSRKLFSVTGMIFYSVSVGALWQKTGNSDSKAK